MADLETKKTSELPVNSSPSASTTLVGVDNGGTVQIPISEFVTKDENGDVSVNALTANSAWFWSEDDSKKVSLRCDDNGKLILDGKEVATVDDIPSGGSSTPSYSEGLTYQLTTDKTGYAVTHIGTCTDTDIIIPPIYNGLPVKEIFGWSNTTIISVTLPNSIISMGNYVFKGCSNLIKIIIPDSVTTIGEDIFKECPNVTVYCEAKSKPEGWHSRWDRSARHVVWNAFDFIGVHEHIENGLSKYVTEAELEEKGYLTETELDAKGYATEEYVDEKVSSMSGNGGGTSSGGDSSIIDLGTQGNHKDAQQAIVDHLTQMNADDGCYLFKYWCGCSENACFAVVLQAAEYNYVEGTVYDGIHRYRYFCYEYSQGEFTTDGCWLNIASFDESFGTLPTENKTVLGAIEELYSLAIDGYKSTWNFSYSSIDEDTPYYIISGGHSSSTTTEILIPSRIDGIPVTSIADEAFKDYSSLTSVTIPNSVTSIGEYAFMFCSNLSDLKLSNNLISIGKQAFYQCDSLTEIVIPNSVTSIDANAFAQCDNLKTVIIPASVTTINNRAFHNCPNLTIYCEAPSKPTGWTVLWNESNCPVVWGFANNFIDVNNKLDEIGTGGSGGATLSMPRIRLANHWQGEDGVTCNKESNEWLGSYIFSVEIMDGTVQEGDQLQICSLTNHKNSRGVRVRKPRRFSERVITAEDIEMLSYNPYLQILVEGKDLRELYRSCSSDGTLYRYPKYIRIRRPKYDEEGQETGATFSNVVCADVRLPVTFFYD